MAEAQEFITLARVVKTQGRHGEVAAEVHSDVPDRFVGGNEVAGAWEDPATRGANWKLKGFGRTKVCWF